jgi:hypothetical protein
MPSILKNQEGWGITVALLPAIGLNLMFFALGFSGAPRRDSTAFYTAGYIIREGCGEHLYNFDEQISKHERLFGKHSYLPYFSLPYFALAWVPFTYLDYKGALIVWGLLTLAFGLTATWKSSRIAPVALAAFPTTGITLIQGQASFLLLGVYGTSLYLLSKKRNMGAGAVLAIALFKPHLALSSVLFLAIRRDWKFVVGFAVGAVTLILISFLITGPRALPDLISLISLTQQQQVVELMPNIRGAIYSNINLHWLAFSLTAIISGVVIAYTIRATKGMDPERAFCISMLATILISYHFLLHDLTLLLLALPLFFGRKFTIAVAIISPILLILLFWNICWIISMAVASAIWVSHKKTKNFPVT